MKIFKFNIEHIAEDRYIMKIYNMPKHLIGNSHFFKYKNYIFSSANTFDFDSGAIFYFPGSRSQYNQGNYEKTFYSDKSRVEIFNKMKLEFDFLTRKYFNSKQLEFSFDIEEVFNNIDYELVKSKTKVKNTYGIRINVSRLENTEFKVLPLSDNSFTLHIGTTFTKVGNAFQITTGQHRLHFSSKEERDKYFEKLKLVLEKFKIAKPHIKKNTEVDALEYIKNIYKKS